MTIQKPVAVGLPVRATSGCCPGQPRRVPFHLIDQRCTGHARLWTIHGYSFRTVFSFAFSLASFTLQYPTSPGRFPALSNDITARPRPPTRPHPPFRQPLYIQPCIPDCHPENGTIRLSDTRPRSRYLRVYTNSLLLSLINDTSFPTLRPRASYRGAVPTHPRPRLSFPLFPSPRFSRSTQPPRLNQPHEFRDSYPASSLASSTSITPLFSRTAALPSSLRVNWNLRAYTSSKQSV